MTGYEGVCMSGSRSEYCPAGAWTRYGVTHVTNNNTRLAYDVRISYGYTVRGPKAHEDLGMSMWWWWWWWWW